MDVTSFVPLSPAAGKPAIGGAAPAPEAARGYRVEALDRLMDQAVRAGEDVAREPLGRTPPKLKVTLNIDEATNRVVAALIDPESGEVKQELPPEELLRSAAQLHELLDRLIDIEA